MEVLFLAHRVPFPPDRGDKIRSYHVLKHIAGFARVHLVAFADDARDLDPPPDLRALVGECLIAPRSKSRPRAAAEALATGRPLSLTAFADRRLAKAVRRVLTRHPIDAVYAFSGQMAQYLPADTSRTVMDFVDRDSAKFTAYADDAHGPMRWLMRREARLLGAYETRIASRVDAALFVSAAEAALMPGARALENGIDTGLFDPAATFARRGEGGLIVFTGQMDYRPNIDAVTRFARDSLPAIRARHPGTRFAIVGRAPTGAVRALAGEGVIVTGEVTDVRPWLAAAAVVVAPLQLARGVQNKVLEAMAMARPVVASGAAAEGIDHAGTIAVADDPVEAVCELLGDPARAAELGAAARARVVARYGWDARLAGLKDLLSPSPLQGRGQASEAKRGRGKQPSFGIARADGSSPLPPAGLQAAPSLSPEGKREPVA